MNTSYSTLRLSAPEEVQEARKGRFVVGSAVALLALGATAMVLSGTTLGASSSAVNVGGPFSAARGDVAPCVGPSAAESPTPAEELAYLNSLPRWDPEYSIQADFYNACYYSFRCCSITGASDGCYVSDNFGTSCRSCLAQNPPAMVNGKCSEYLQLFDEGFIQSSDQIDPAKPVMNYVKLMDPSYGLPPVLNQNTNETSPSWESDESKEEFCADKWGDGVFPISCPKYEKMLNAGEGAWLEADRITYRAGETTCATVCEGNAKALPTTAGLILGFGLKTEAGGAGMLNSCWVQPGATDPRVAKQGMFADKCFEVISWCNLLCPRDTPQTVDHVMCKHCQLFGFKETSWDSVTFSDELGALQGEDASEAQENVV